MRRNGGILNINYHIDGGKSQGFTSCVLGGSALLTGCGCADLDANVVANASDLSLLADKLMMEADPACP